MNHPYIRTALLSLSLVFVSSCTENKTPDPASAYDITLLETDFAAHWVRENVLLVNNPTNHAYLLASTQSRLDEGESADWHYPLKAIDQPEWVKIEYPHLAEFFAFELALPSAQIKTLLKQQLAVLQLNKKEQATRLSYVQHAGVLDQLYTSGESDADETQYFGATLQDGLTQFTLWAPTALSVSVNLYDEQFTQLESGQLPMTFNSQTGNWSVQTDLASQGSYYRYSLSSHHPSTQAIEQITVTDPYSLSLSTNSRYSQVVDLNNAESQPADWQNQIVPDIARPEAYVLYEMHIRDFSATDSTLSSPDHAGKYKAFSETESNGIKHLTALKGAGLNVVHLLPTYDISTVNEDPDNVIYPSDPLEKVCSLLSSLPLCQQGIPSHTTLNTVLQGFDPLSSDAQTVIEQLRQLDPYNWGYDPYHYTVPEGSYAMDSNGIARIVEFREMVKNLHNMGYRVIMDVVYNHTFASALEEHSVLDKVVPNYYHRLDPVSGVIEQSTCCDNSATENAMMAKLMIDSLVVWSRDYKIDGFRFDLMGHQPKSLMLQARDAVREVDEDTYFYGEGWNFGEVADNARFVQATQLELAGTEIGTFTDRLRDAVRGGSSFVSGEEIRLGQGIGNGLLTIPNELQNEQNAALQLAEYNLSMDQLRVGLAGNLADFPLQNAQGLQVTGKDIDYGGAPTGYALDPADTINYVSKHDNQTLWDNNQYRIAHSVSTDDRMRMQMLSLAYPLLAQGIPFFHMGSELLRSKSFLRDSYDYGDWFNQVDFSKQSNNYNRGLPPQVKDGDNWPIISQIIKANDGRDEVSPEHIQRASNIFMNMLAIRTSSPLFSLESAEQIIERVKFHNTGPTQQQGVIVMSISDFKGDKDLDENINNLLVIFNNGPEHKQVAYPNAINYSLHDRQLNGVDERIKQAVANEKGFTVPGLSVAIFVN